MTDLLDLRAVEVRLRSHEYADWRTLWDDAGALLLALRDARVALSDCVSALDDLMGDTDLEGDTSREFRAIQRGIAVLDSIADEAAISDE